MYVGILIEYNFAINDIEFEIEFFSVEHRFIEYGRDNTFF